MKKKREKKPKDDKSITTSSIRNRFLLSGRLGQSTISN